MKNKHILVIVTGGTISMEKETMMHKVVVSNAHTTLLDQMASSLPNIKLSVIEFSNKPSPSLKMADLFSLGKLTKESIESSDIDGIVITHGTDTLEETAYFLDLFVNAKKPVVITGAMRSYSELGFDGTSNLLSAILVASDIESASRGVLVVMNDEINAASEVTKSHTLALDTFKSLDFGPIGIIDDERVIYYRKTENHSKSLEIVNLHNQVEILKMYIGANDFILNALIDANISGVIIEGLGRGNIPPDMIPGIKRALELKIPVVLTSRCPKGRVLDTYAYEGGGYFLKQLGVIFAPNLNSQKARIKLILALAVTRDMEEIRKIFE